MKFSYHKHCPTDYKERDMVLVKFNRRKFKDARGVHQILVQNYEGPFNIIAKGGQDFIQFGATSTL